MKTLRILIVEDDAIVAMVLKELLTVMGHEVCATAITRFDAVGGAGRHKPDLVIADGTLGRESGISAVDEILRAGPVPLFVSGDVGRIQSDQAGRNRRPKNHPIRSHQSAGSLVRKQMRIRAGLMRHKAGGTVTEIVVPGGVTDVARRPPSFPVSASMMLVPSPTLWVLQRSGC
jgi:chemotaxis response regulator CheB